MHRHMLSCCLVHLLNFSSPSVHFKNDPEYLTRRTAHVFSPLMWFMQCSLFRVVFFFILSCVSECLMVSTSNIAKFMEVFFLWKVLVFSWFGSSIPSVFRRFLLFIWSLAHFSMPNFDSILFVVILSQSLCILIIIVFTSLHVYYYFSLFRVFHTGIFFLENDWQQIPSSLQDFSQYDYHHNLIPLLILLLLLLFCFFTFYSFEKFSKRR